LMPTILREATQRLSGRGGAISVTHSRTSHDEKHAPAARVQRFVMLRRYLPDSKIIERRG
jgi:hypothetical protein